ncbi:carotenoid oxygenase family protein [Phenylobacterium sp.]|uniref:carotenoid oxygenase family protein n=1 Tax=Phenylobacterium sp. TaxID=1871053 RepID=UPI0025D7CB6E|nr:carotenoid oxygenase family protein [Phenylobacterium sp.]MCA6288361.1 carotenoid oxygenase family protein [Phenylobacterium sp.]MCA6342600.1 carotenoid oxygenase family protein [Phenylobacterium sp.]
MSEKIRSNPYLTGNFAPLHSEDDFELEVVGDLPAGLEGALYRTGPNPQFQPLDPNYHWFTGDGMVHAFRIGGGKVAYRNRYVRTPKWELEHQHGRALFGGFNPMLSDPLAAGQDSGVANTNILFHAGRLLALEEGHMPFEIDRDTLEPRGYASEYVGRVTAHPKLDPKTGEMIWFGYGVGPRPFSTTMSYGVTDATGKVVRRTDFEAPYSAMVHDFLVTENYVLFPVMPLTGSLERAMKGLPGYAWEPDKPSYVGLMKRGEDPSRIRWFTTQPGYVFHPMNAYEADGRIVAEVCLYDAAPLFPLADGRPGSRSGARLTRWEFDLTGATDQVKETAIDDLDSEFPRLDERFAGLAYRHGYYAADTTGAKSVKMNAIAHMDLKTGTRKVCTFEPGDQVSEPVFVPRSETAAEGQGWLTAVVWRAAENRSDLIILDASDVDRGPVALAKVPRRVPFGFHGNWVNA